MIIIGSLIFVQGGLKGVIKNKKVCPKINGQKSNKKTHLMQSFNSSVSKMSLRPQAVIKCH